MNTKIVNYFNQLNLDVHRERTTINIIKDIEAKTRSRNEEELIGNLIG